MESFNTYLKSLIMLMLCMALYSCGITGNESNVYDGKKLAAFEFSKDQVEAAKDKPYRIELEVQIILPKGGMLEEALPVNFKVVDSATTATSPDDYTFVTPSPVTVPAGSLKTELVISVDGSTIPPGEAHVLTIQLTGNEQRGIGGADIIGQFKLTIAGN